jgi:hypothetical protein
MKERQANGRASVSPSGIKGCSSMNYQQFGENIEEISFEVVCSYTEIYNEQIHDLLDSSGNAKL